MDSSNREERFADDLQPVADALREQRPTLDPLALDRIKLRAMGGARQSAFSRQKGFVMRSRLTTLLTIAFLSLGTGGALAWVGGEHFGLDSGDHGSASSNQYRCDHGNGKGKDHECHGHEGEPPGHSGEPPPGHGGPERGLGGGSDHGHSGDNGNGHAHGH